MVRYGLQRGQLSGVPPDDRTRHTFISSVVSNLREYASGHPATRPIVIMHATAKALLIDHGGRAFALVRSAIEMITVAESAGRGIVA